MIIRSVESRTCAGSPTKALRCQEKGSSICPCALGGGRLRRWPNGRNGQFVDSAISTGGNGGSSSSVRLRLCVSRFTGGDICPRLDGQLPLWPLGLRS